MSDLDAIAAELEQVVAAAVDAASSLEELLDCAKAAAGLGRPAILDAVAEKLAAEVHEAAESSSAWVAELTYSSKVEAWSQTGHRARLLAEIYEHVARGRRAAGGQT